MDRVPERCGAAKIIYGSAAPLPRLPGMDVEPARGKPGRAARAT